MALRANAAQDSWFYEFMILTSQAFGTLLRRGIAPSNTKTEAHGYICALNRARVKTSRPIHCTTYR